MGEPSETRLEEPSGSEAALEGAEDAQALHAVAAEYPLCLAAWASLGEAALEAARPVEAYAYFRVGYHRGLDQIRKAGWRGSGRVPWAHPANRGFLRSLKGLGQAAAVIGEGDEARRCEAFLDQIAPDAPGG